MKQFDITFKSGDHLTVTAEFMHASHQPEPDEFTEFSTGGHTVALVAASEVQSVLVQILAVGDRS